MTVVAHSNRRPTHLICFTHSRFQGVSVLVRFVLQLWQGEIDFVQLVVQLKQTVVECFDLIAQVRVHCQRSVALAPDGVQLFGRPLAFLLGNGSYFIRNFLEVKYDSLLACGKRYMLRLSVVLHGGLESLKISNHFRPVRTLSVFIWSSNMSFGFSKAVSRRLNSFEIFSSPAAVVAVVDIALFSFSLNALHSAIRAPTFSISFCPSEIGKTLSDSFSRAEQVFKKSSATFKLDWITYNV